MTANPLKKLEKGTFGIFPTQYLAGLTGHEQIVFCWIGSFLNDEGIAWPSIKTLTKKAGLSKYIVRQSIESLEKKGLIQRTKRHKENSQENDSALYRVIIVDVVKPLDHVVKSFDHPGQATLPQVVKPVDSNQIHIKPNKITIPEHLQEVWEKFREVRRDKKSPLTLIAEKNALARLQRLSESEREQVKIVQEAVDHSWLTFYALKDGEKPPKYEWADASGRRFDQVELEPERKSEYKRLYPKEYTHFYE